MFIRLHGDYVIDTSEISRIYPLRVEERTNGFSHKILIKSTPNAYIRIDNKRFLALMDVLKRNDKIVNLDDMIEEDPNRYNITG